MRTVRPLVLGPLLAATALWSGAASASPEAPALETRAGVRLGVGTALSSRTDPMALASLHADVRLMRGNLFVAIAPGLYLPGGTASDLTYGGLGMDLGAGWRLSRGALSPYLGAGVSGRLQLYEASRVAGFAPYAHLGVMGHLGASAGLFVEGRAYQNVIGVENADHAVFPTEVGLAVGVTF